MTRKVFFFNKFAACAAIYAMLAPALVMRAETPNSKPLTEDQKILHVLNRLGFGARPGDVEKVKAMGLQKYIDQQLNPSSIADPLAEAKVKGLDIFAMSTADLFAKYPNPGALLQQLDGRDKANQLKNAKADAKANAANGPGQPGQPGDANQLTQEQQRARRQEIQQLYIKYDLKPAQQIMPEIVANRVLRAVYSERQLQEVMVDFWQNHFNVFAGKAAVRWFIPAYERDVIRPNALGNFKDLLVGTAKSPAMLFYLDNFESVSPNAPQPGQNAQAQRIQQMIRNGQPIPPQARERMKQQFGLNDAQLDARLEQMRNAPAPQQQKRGINENYARELMELHTLGVDNGYTQKDIIEVAKCFTGWTIADPRGYRKLAALDIQGKDDRALNRLQRLPGVPDDLESGEFYFNPVWHENGPKMVMGQKIDEGGIKDGLKVLDMLVENPYTAKFIAKKLAIKFVSDNPSDALVQRVADAFHSSHGDIKTTLRALFSDKEFFAPENYRAKIKSPFELAVSAIRAIGADTNGSPAMVAMLNKLGEVPYGYQAPTGYPDKAEDWVNTGALLERLNFAVAVSSNRIPGTIVNLKGFDSNDKMSVLDKAIAQILNGDISSATKATLVKQIEQPLPAVKEGSDLADQEMEVPNMRPGQQGGQNRQARLLEPSGNPDVFKVVSLVLGTPEFQRQ
ncbi:MAG: DUF1800 domain-containing protein [Acidobacteria bacterium]|nr:DUF1800 domain-containing protein [Acidobacteriota bacterium]